MKTISFRADMINLILTVKKTATIRPIKEQIDMFFLSDDFLKKIYYTWPGSHQLRSAGWIADQCPYGKVGDVIAVRELVY
jgi:hypothetical protein